MTPIALQLALLLFASVAVGGLLPYARRWSEGGLHGLVALSAGIFLGTVALHLVPELAAAAAGELHDHGAHAHHGHDHGAHDHSAHDHGGPGGALHVHAPLSGALGAWVWVAMAFGVFGLWLLERLWVHPHLASHGHGTQHQLAWRATLFGLSVHALLTGLGLAAVADGHDRWALWSAMVLHKVTEGFSLGTLLRLARLRLGAALAVVLGFSAVAPLGLLAGRTLAVQLGPFADLLTAFAAGTFLYVAVFELLPEAWHGQSRRIRRVLLVGLGFALAGAVPALDAALLSNVARESANVFVAMAPYLLLGLGLAGLLHAWIGPGRLRRAMAGRGPGPVVRAALFGAPLPLCSCAVMPLAASLRRGGAGAGPTSAFLISTPETGPDSVLATAALFDPWMAVARPVAAVSSAVVVGLAVGAVEAQGPRFGPAERSGADGNPLAPPAAQPAMGVHHGDHGDHGEHGEHGACCDVRAAPAKSASRWQAALHHGAIDLVDDIATPLVLGILAAGLVSAALPEGFWTSPLLAGALAYPLLALVGMPLYLCAAAATPIAAAMVSKGVSPGAALVFLLAAPALNGASFFFLRKLLGSRLAWVHMGVLAAVTIGLGVALDGILLGVGAAPTVAGVQVGHGWPPGVAEAGACALLVLLLGSFLRSLRQVALGRNPAPAPGEALTHP